MCSGRGRVATVEGCSISVSSRGPNGVVLGSIADRVTHETVFYEHGVMKYSAERKRDGHLVEGVVGKEAHRNQKSGVHYAHVVEHPAIELSIVALEKAILETFWSGGSVSSRA